MQPHSHFIRQVTEGKGLAKVQQAKGRASIQTQVSTLLPSPMFLLSPKVYNVIQSLPVLATSLKSQQRRKEGTEVPLFLTCLPPLPGCKHPPPGHSTTPAAPLPCPSLQLLQGPGTHLVLLEAHVALFLVPGEGLAAAPNTLAWPHTLHKISWEEANPVADLALGMRLA